jgi:hypothetical protein
VLLFFEVVAYFLHYGPWNRTDDHSYPMPTLPLAGIGLTLGKLLGNISYF